VAGEEREMRERGKPKDEEQSDGHREKAAASDIEIERVSAMDLVLR